ncbi:MAG: amidase [Pseudonocardiales bacterium]|nr:amidase [Pseudonocardiales bacterium]
MPAMRMRRRRTGTIAAVGVLAAAICSGFVGSSSASPKPTTIELETATIQQLHGLFASHKLTAVALSKMYLQRISELNSQGPSLNAVRIINPDWQKQAAKVDELSAHHVDLGPMMGIPVLVKDNIDVQGLPTPAGSVALANSYPATDAPVIKQLKAAGAIILGKANLAEFAYYTTSTAPNGYSSLGGQVLNPYDAALNPGGSSSGSAAAMAVGMAAGTVGSDTGGSILQPSNNMSDIGVRPTVGLLSRSGVVPISATNDTTGPITHTVWDAAAMLTAMTTGVDPGDPATATAGKYDSTDYTKALSSTALEGARLGYVAAAAPDPLYDAALQALRDQGATLVPVDLSAANLPTRVWDYEFKKDLNSYLGKLPASDKVRSLADVIAYNKTHANVALKFGETLLEGAQAINVDDPATAASYEALRVAGLSGAQSRIDTTLKNNNLTAIVFAGQSGNTIVTRAAYPAVMMRAGYQDGTRHPEGLEMIGTAYSEATLLGYAYDYEQATHLWQPPSVVNPTLFRCVGAQAQRSASCPP